MATVDYARLVAKAWVLYDQTGTPAVLDSENVTSVTDIGTGLFTVNWNQDFANANYCAVTMVGDEALAQTMSNESGSGASHLAGSLGMAIRTAVGLVDRSRNGVAAFGDLA